MPKSVILKKSKSSISFAQMEDHLTLIKNQLKIPLENKFVEEFDCTNETSLLRSVVGVIYIFQKVIGFRSSVYRGDVVIPFNEMKSMKLSDPTSFKLTIRIEKKNGKSYLFGGFANVEAVFNIFLFLWERRYEKDEIFIAGKTIDKILGSVKYPKETSIMMQSFPKLSYKNSECLVDCIFFIFNIILFIIYFLYLLFNYLIILFIILLFIFAT